MSDFNGTTRSIKMTDFDGRRCTCCAPIANDFNGTRSVKMTDFDGYRCSCCAGIAQERDELRAEVERLRAKEVDLRGLWHEAAAQLEAVRQGAERFLRYLRTIEKRGPQTPHEREVRGFAMSILGATDRALAATEGGGGNDQIRGAGGGVVDSGQPDARTGRAAGGDDEPQDG
jgi:hypothetical protein